MTELVAKEVKMAVRYVDTNLVWHRTKRVYSFVGLMQPQGR